MQEIIDKMYEAAASYEKDEVVRLADFPVGSWWAQGDIQIQRIEKPSTGAETTNRQLVQGSTKGSRHVLEGSARVFKRDSGPLVGPVFEALDRCVVTHPEHRHVSLPKGWYSVTYQRDFSREEIERVRD